MQQVTAQLRYYRMGPRKMRLLIDLIRGKKVTTAQGVLSVLNKKGALPLLKLLNSAVANAKHNYSLDVENLRIAAATVDGGPVLKRWMPKAHGRATPVRERTSHVKLVLEAFEVKQKSKVKKSEARNSKSETNSNVQK